MNTELNTGPDSNADKSRHKIDLAAQARHVKQCLREVWFVFVVIAVVFVWSFSVFAWQGYAGHDSRPNEPVLILGIPHWVALGLFLPWIATIVATWIFAVFILQDDEPL